ncbi:hypothetical protein [Micromonospora craniellae]|uniref:Uncharacterized protein n=1 Tax=Micromonospora craniellae TaxID=2294034 RepID=A0A372FYR8_9ACTN|nr:hypothetical protein [Micromonospora craniellae]RFS45629.1 hypothetical protein D0Q02_16180 [Micromonospora craniellae]
MTTLGFQTALARLLVEPALRERWSVDPDTVASDLSLTIREREMLAAVDPGRLDFTAGGIARARSRTLKRMFAATLRAIGDPPTADRLVSEFVRSVVPLAARDEATKWIKEGDRFVEYLSHVAAAGDVPTPLAELARLEWLRAELRYSPDAARSAEHVHRHHDPTTPPAVTTVLRLAAHVRVVRFDADVLALAAGRAPAQAGPTCLALASRPDGTVRTYRLSPQAHDLYQACDGQYTVAALTATGPSDAADLLTTAWAHGLVRDAAPTGCLGTCEPRPDPPAPDQERPR